jgi:hypothetical protein
MRTRELVIPGVIEAAGLQVEERELDALRPAEALCVFRSTRALVPAVPDRAFRSTRAPIGAKRRGRPRRSEATHG